jgi:predicted ArsR family transcriptional regulator
MVKKNNLLNKYERLILELLNRSPAPLSTNQIAERLGISYITAIKHLNLLLKKKLVINHDRKN